MELHLQHLLRTQGLEKTVTDNNLFYKRQGDGKVIFKYRQISADFTVQAVLESRGIILNENDNWNAVSVPYFKFFNVGESLYKEIDFSTSKIFEKLDGTMICMYYWMGTWRTQTSRLIDGELSLINNTTFNDLCVLSINEMYGDYDKFVNDLNTNYCYMFELCTPENTIVVQHTEYKLILHGVRNLTTLKEIDIEDPQFDNIIKVKSYTFSNIEEIKDFAKTLHWSEEGYVCVDENFNRGKIKGKDYVARHYTSTAVSKYYVLDIIKANELEEYFVYFKTEINEIKNIEIKYYEFISNLEKAYNNIHFWKNKKDYALIAKSLYKSHELSYCLNRYNGRYNNAKEYVDTVIKNSELYKLLKK